MLKGIATDPNTGKIDQKKLQLLWDTLKAGAIGAYWLRQTVICKDNGEGATGKSTFTDLLENLVGKQNIANLRLVDLQDPTKLVEATQVNLIIGDDNDPSIPLKKFDNFNTVVSSDPLRVRNYYKESYSTRLSIFMIQSANGLPPLEGAKSAVYNRLEVIDFNHRFDPRNKNNWLVKHDYIKRPEVLKWLLNYLLTQVHLGIALTDTEESQRELKEIRTETDTVYTFSKEMLDQIPAQEVPTAYMFALYFNWCRSNGISKNKILSQRKFTRELQKQEDWKKNWEYKSKNCYISNPASFIPRNVQEMTTDPFKNFDNCYDLITDLSAQVNDYQTMIYNLNQSTRYTGGGFIRSDSKYATNNSAKN